ncbi:hypothetical protein [Cellulosilyticum lentocellum]|uniref:Antitoxin SocA-like Panacea domain-containing protein n=1 Tax=Cellulosilyticum lentocellum (strain ATCC 49066 / DSM 5427 / NCIMB 11756 / RHM5) TaxID=642492 RepID=F2JRB4_CELLD|nr:hypothetical protein [Cellulosilyticum lentocellum]ADZ82723.1 hypothetical protein Clole_0991 [Cellulosilyticum lentocellum DSM 5427]
MCILKNKKTEKKLYCLLTQLGYNFSEFKSSKKYRIIFQKLVYAMQRNGFNFGYSYNLYINGPYCPELASKGYDMVAHLDEFETDPTPFVLSVSGEAKLEKVKQYLDNNYDDSDWLETIATLDFLKNEFFDTDTSKEVIFAKFATIKPHLYQGHEMTLSRAWELVEGVQ